jgi:WD40 repeat protein
MIGLSFVIFPFLKYHYQGIQNREDFLMLGRNRIILAFYFLILSIFIKTIQAQETNALSLDNIDQIERVRSFEIENLDAANYFFPSPDGRYLMLGNFFGSSGNIYFVTVGAEIILLRDVATGELVKQNARNRGEIVFFDFSSDSRWLAVGYRNRGNGTVEIWDLETLATKHILDQDVNTLRFSPDNQILAVGTSSNAVHVWQNFEQEEATSRQILRGGNSSVFNIGFTPDSNYILVYLFNGGAGVTPMVVIDSRNRNPHYQSSGAEENRILRPSANIALYYPSMQAEEAAFWDIASLEIISQFDELGFWVENHALSLDETMFISSPDEGELVIWDIRMAESVYRFENEDYGFFSPNGQEIITLSGTTLSVWHIPN